MKEPFAWTRSVTWDEISKGSNCVEDGTHRFPSGYLFFGPDSWSIFGPTSTLSDQSRLCDEETSRGAGALLIVLCYEGDRRVGIVNAVSCRGRKHNTMRDLDISNLCRLEQL